MKTKKELKNEFKSIKYKYGVFQIINKIDNRVYLQSSSDLDRAFNSDVFQLNAGLHSNPKLQKDWKNLGSDHFDFIILDELKYVNTSTLDELKSDLKILLDMHFENFKNINTPMY